MTDWLLDGVFGWLAQRLLDALGWLVNLLTSTFFTSPDLTVFPQVQALADRSRLVVGSAFVPAIVAAGAIGMTLRHRLRGRRPVRLLRPLPRPARGAWTSSGS